MFVPIDAAEADPRRPREDGAARRARAPVARRRGGRSAGPPHGLARVAGWPGRSGRHQGRRHHPRRRRRRRAHAGRVLPQGVGRAAAPAPTSLCACCRASTSRSSPSVRSIASSTSSARRPTSAPSASRHARAHDHAPAHRRRPRLARHLARRRKRAGRDRARLSAMRTSSRWSTSCPRRSGRGLLGKRARTTFLQRIPGARRHFRLLLPLFPRAIESLDVSAYDLVISSSHAVAKGVRTSPAQLHVCYCHTPMRYAWDLRDQYLAVERARDRAARRARPSRPRPVARLGPAQQRARHAIRRQLAIRARSDRALLRPRRRRSSIRRSTPISSRPRRRGAPTRATTTSPRRAGSRTSGWTSSPQHFAAFPSGA